MNDDGADEQRRGVSRRRLLGGIGAARREPSPWEPRQSPRHAAGALALVAVIAALAVPAPAFGLGEVLPGAPACDLCANFVTTFDSDGDGGVPAFTRLHRDLVVNVPYVLDVDGNLPPVAFAPADVYAQVTVNGEQLVHAVPGYEMKATVQTLTGERSTVRLSKLATSLEHLPLRAEVIAGEVGDAGAGKTTFGYDTLDSTAPQSWTAAVDVSNRDQNPDTMQARIDMEVRGAGKTLTVLNEQFAGDPVGSRTNRSIRRVQFAGDATTTVVPTRAVADLTMYEHPTTDESSQQLVLTHTERTTMKFEVVQPSGARTTGSLGELPAFVDLTLRRVDLNGDMQLDNTIDYEASAEVALAEITTRTASQTTALSIEALPASADLTYITRPTAAAVAAGASDTTKMDYTASGRAERMAITTDDGKRKIVADVTNLPKTIHELSATRSEGSATTPPGGAVTYRADARTDQVKVVVDDAADGTSGATHAELKVQDVPSEISLHYAGTAAAGRVHYAAAGDPAARADAMIVDGQGQQYTIGVDRIPSDILIDFKRPSPSRAEPMTFDYTASSTVPRVEIHGTNLKGSSDVKQFHLTLTDVPVRVSLVRQDSSNSSATKKELPPPAYCFQTTGGERQYCPDNGEDYIRLYETTTITKTAKTFMISTPDAGVLGTGEFQLTNGPDTRLPVLSPGGRPQDGVLVRNLPGERVIHARVTGLDSVGYTKQEERQHVDGPGLPCCDYAKNHLNAYVYATAPGHELTLDLAQEASGEVKKTLARVANLPGGIEIDLKSDKRLNSTSGEVESSESFLDWNAGQTIDGYSTGPDHFVPAFRLDETVESDGTTAITKSAIVSPMPADFSVCQTFNDCAVGVFNQSLDKLHHGIQPWLWHTCFVDCPTTFPSSKTDFAQMSVRIDATVPVSLRYFDGRFVDAQPEGNYTSVNLGGLKRLIIQGDRKTYDCDLDLATCQYGYLGLDTGGAPLSGNITVRGHKLTRFDLPVGFTASGLVFAFHKTGIARGHIGEAGALSCPEGTGVIINDQKIDGRFCDGNILEGTILDGL